MTPLKHLSGCFTKQISLQGASLSEIERRLGFQNGRLGRGATFYVATQLPGIDDFDLAGYTQVASHHTMERYGNLNNPKGIHEVNAYRIKKQNAMREWSLNGSGRLVKVVPGTDHDPALDADVQYPPGSGVPQWVVKRDRKISCRQIAQVLDYPNGRFIPDEGYTAVNYGR